MMTETQAREFLAINNLSLGDLIGHLQTVRQERDEALASIDRQMNKNLEMQALLDGRLEENEKLTAQNARLRAALKMMTRHAKECQSMYGIDGQACIDEAYEALAETPAESLDAVRAEARREAERGKVSSTFGDLVKGCETLSHRIESHAWDNMPMWEQRDWLIAQAELLHQQWCEKWRKTLDRESDSKAELQEALESDRINVIQGVNRLTKEIESRAWLATGARSSYEWDDARYQQEFHDAAEAILEALEPLKKIGADLSNCPADAKRSLERMRAEAGRERSVRELRACADSLWDTAETFIDATHPGWRPALKAASERCHSRAEKIAKEGKLPGERQAMNCDHEFGAEVCPKCGIELLPDGCGYQGYEFGANYPDSICYGGRLWNADLCDGEGNLLEPGEYIPCPMCHRKEAIAHWAGVNRNSGMKREQAQAAAKSLVDDIRNNRANGTEPWKKRIN